jgi:phosphatidylethanolamine-binding protein (PEBP) family uncharacterized protein
MMAKQFSFLVLCTLAFFGICSFLQGQAVADEPSLDVSFEFTAENKGPRGPSPAITVKGIPAGTVELKVALKDIDSPRFKHGGGTATVNQGESDTIIPAGALNNQYEGPHPPRGKVHRYTFTVTAIGPNGTELATGVAERTFKGL